MTKAKSAPRAAGGQVSAARTTSLAKPAALAKPASQTKRMSQSVGRRARVVDDSGRTQQASSTSQTKSTLPSVRPVAATGGPASAAAPPHGASAALARPLTRRRGRPPTKAARGEYHHGDLRRALIDAALVLIGEGELGTLSLREVARRAGVTAGAPYHHFSDKIALLAAVAEEGFEALTLRLDAALRDVAARDTRGRLTALARAYIAFARAHQAHYRVMFLPEVKHHTASASVLAAADRALGRLVTAIQSAAPRADEAALRARAVMSWAAGHGLVLLWNDGMLAHKFPARSERELVDLAADQMVTLALARPR